MSGITLDDPIVRTFKIVMPYQYFAGKAATRFLRELEENRRIVGLKCEQCNRVYVPPRMTCARCFSDLSEWVNVGNRGELISYTMIHKGNSAQPIRPPFAYGIVKLDGADTGLTHFIGEVSEDAISIGMRVEAVFDDKPVATIMAIKYFRPCA